MKKILSFIGAALIGVFAMTSCTPDDYGTVDPNGIPSLEGVEPVVQVDQNINQVTFSLPEGCKGVMPIWIFDGKTYSTVNGLKKIFASAGDYTAEFKLMNKNGVSDGSKSFTFHIDNTIFNFDKYYTLMCGGAEGSDATKEWRIDNKAKGHMGCGEPGTTGTNWWSAGEDDKAAFGVYDNRVTFGANNTYTFDPGEAGTMYVNVGCSIFSEYNTTGEDFCVPMSAKTAEYKFDVVGDDLYLTLPAETPFPYVPYDANWTSPRFKVESVTPSTINLVADNGDIAWHFILTSGAAEVKFTGFNYKHEANIWRLVDEKADYTTSFWYAPGWNQIADPGFKQDGDAYTFTLPQATTDQWQAQCFIIPNNLQLESSKTYDFSCVISSTTDIDGVTVKVPNVADNGPALFTERFPVKAYEDYVFYITDVAGFDDVAKLVLDFGGNKDNCEVTVKNIVLKDHAVDDGTVLPSDEPGDEPGAVEWNGKNLLEGMPVEITQWYAPGWNQIADAEYSAVDGVYTISYTEATTDQWQAQFTFNNTGIALDPSKTYDFRCKIVSNTDHPGVTVKLTQQDDDKTFLTEGRHKVKAYEETWVELTDLAFTVVDGGNGIIDNLKIPFDFGGVAAGTEIVISDMYLQEHKSPVVLDYNDADNLWKAVDEGSAFISVTPWFANDGWGQIADPVWSHDGNVWELVLSDGIGGTQWQGQFPINTTLTAAQADTYSFSCTVEIDNNAPGVTIKLTETDDAEKHDNNFFFADRHEIKAYEPYIYTVSGVQLPQNDAHALSLFFDFGGTPAGSNVKISNIVFKKN